MLNCCCWDQLLFTSPHPAAFYLVKLPKIGAKTLQAASLSEELAVVLGGCHAELCKWKMAYFNWGLLWEFALSLYSWALL